MLTFNADPDAAAQEMYAIIFYLSAFAFIDGNFDERERAVLRAQLRRLVAEHARDAAPDADEAQIAEVVALWGAHFEATADAVEAQIADMLTESVGDGESSRDFVLSRLKLRCLELFRTFDEESRRTLLEIADEVIDADGIAAPEELALREELLALLREPQTIAATDETPEGEAPPSTASSLVVAEAVTLEPREEDRAELRASEWDYTREPAAFAREIAFDVDLVDRAIAILDGARAAGDGMLASVGAGDASAFAGSAPFLDGHVQVLMPEAGRDYELLVLGDLHGCYSCLKAALLQADFFGKLAAWRERPDDSPAVQLVLLGDYIDRGRFSWSGVLRAALELLVAAPEAVVLLRGNHEAFVEKPEGMAATVIPAEALFEIGALASREVLRRYLTLFESLPHALIFDRVLFAHGGIPRDETIARVWTGLASLNDPDVRREMLWSDPADVDVVPESLQRASARFSFGRSQLRDFLARVGVSTLVRGHERVVEGFRRVWDEEGATLLSLFSAGGDGNRDLPAESNYHEVTPMALTLRHRDGASEVTPFAIDWARYNDPAHNAFFARALDGATRGR